MQSGDGRQGAGGAHGVPGGDRAAAAPVRATGWRLRGAVTVAAVALLILAAGGGSRSGLAVQEEAPETDRSPYAQVIAQGLAFFSPDVANWVWRVREVAPPPEEEAGSAAAIAYSFVWQRTGVSIIFSEGTESRTRLEPGEGYYLSQDRVYSRYAIGDTPSRAWIIELVPADSDASALEGDVVFTSQEITTVPSGTWDLELIRNVLAPGEEADVPGHEGPALILPTFGTIQTVNQGGQAADIAVGDGQLVLDTPILRNPGDQAATYLIAMIGDRVLDPGETPEPEEDEEAAPAATPEGSPAATPEPGPDDDPDEDGLTNTQEEELGTDPNNPDSDGDGLLDGEEAEFGCDPTLVDTDEDGLDDADEVDLETDCSLIDSDGDGYVDGEEVALYFTDPNDPDSNPNTAPD